MKGSYIRASTKKVNTLLPLGFDYFYMNIDSCIDTL